MNFTKNIGMLLLAIFLIIYGIMTAFQVQLPLIIPGILALLAGIFILIRK
jgi:sugar phosphate permease